MRNFNVYWQKQDHFLFFFAEIIIFCLNRFRTVTVVFMFAVRGFVTGAFQAAYVYTPEVRR